jgi:hypothetical protein
MAIDAVSDMDVGNGGGSLVLGLDTTVVLPTSETQLTLEK